MRPTPDAVIHIANTTSLCFVAGWSRSRSSVAMWKSIGAFSYSVRPNSL